jgi:hypothetical protein
MTDPQKVMRAARMLGPAAPTSTPASAGLQASRTRVARMIGAFGLALGLAWNVVLLALAHGHPAYGFEFRGNLWQPGKQILHGNSPYDPAYPKRALSEGLDCCLQALYPAPTHVLFAPLSWLPFDAAMLVFTALAVASLLGGLWLLGMRNPSAFGLVLLAPPVFHGLKLGGVMPFLILGCALCWRWRDRPLLTGVAVAATAILKVFLWPLWLWLLFTHRYRAALISAVSALAMLAAGWAVFGFEHLLDYPRLLMNVAQLEQNDGYSLVRLGGQSLAVTAFVALLLLGRRSFPVIVVAALALTPVVWLQTLPILLVPIVLALNQRETFGKLRLLRQGAIASSGTQNIRPGVQ